jgi:hypothetical protein
VAMTWICHASRNLEASLRRLMTLSLGRNSPPEQSNRAGEEAMREPIMDSPVKMSRRERG